MAGIGGLHIVDLDAAFGRGNNLETISRIIRSAKVPVQVGGGIRTMEVAQRLIDAGADALVVGTVALTDKAIFDRISATVGRSRIIVALDYDGDSVLIEGWRKVSGIKIDQALDRLIGAGVRSFLLTCASRDGMMDGPDVDTIRLVCQSHGEARVFASGGVTSTKDISALRNAGAFAVIVGKAFLEGALSISKAITVAAG
jgi:phosphoribosylformimino-5-aminoimidazole carboxamide ribotide isomerase